MARLGSKLDIERCPHCNIDQPHLASLHLFVTKTYLGDRQRFWRVYTCNRCGGAVLAYADSDAGGVHNIYPPISTNIEESIPDPAREYIKQAVNSLNSPAGAVMLSASAVDAMLKAKGYTEGSLYTRIDQAKENHLITAEMALWAHEIRLEANDPRHADETSPLPTDADARKCLDFVSALGQFIFVLPARIQRGLIDATTPAETEGSDQNESQED